MAQRKPVRVTITVDRHELKKLDRFARRFWPSLLAKRCRAGVFRVLLNERRARADD